MTPSTSKLATRRPEQSTLENRWGREKKCPIVYFFQEPNRLMDVHLCPIWADLQCMMEEWCSPYSSWLSLIKGCSADRSPPSDPPPQLLLFEEGESGVSPEVSTVGSTSAASPFFSSVWRQHIDGCYHCVSSQCPAPVSNANNHTSNINSPFEQNRHSWLCAIY